MTAKLIQVVRNLPSGLRVQLSNKDFEIGDLIRVVTEPAKRFSISDKIKDVYTLSYGNVPMPPKLRQDMEFELVTRPPKGEKEIGYVTYRVNQDVFNNKNGK